MTVAGGKGGGGRGELRGQGPIKMNGTAKLETMMRPAGSRRRGKETGGRGRGRRRGGRERVGAPRYFLASVYVCLTFSCRLPRSVHGLGANSEIGAAELRRPEFPNASFFPSLPPSSSPPLVPFLLRRRAGIFRRGFGMRNRISQRCCSVIETSTGKRN